ncbi:UNVERIFIED_CONTAM: hypothetical protein RMT77_016691 [Armadillidium vulgare]
MILEIFLFVLAIYFISRIFNTKGNLPPGPIGIPYFGSFPYTTLKECIEAKEKYGNIFKVKAGVFNFVYICDFKTVKECLSKFEFADRPEWKTMNIFKGERGKGKCNGIIFSNGSHWVHNRRFLLRHLRDLGMGKSKIEGLIMREVEDLVEDFKGLTKEPSKLPFSINIAVLNIIWQLVSSHRYDFNDTQVELLMGKINEIDHYFMNLFIPEFFPIFTYIIPKPILDYLTGRKEFEKVCQGFQDLIKPFIDDHLKTLNPSDPRDLMDDYVTEMKEGKSEDYSHFDYADLTRITFDLFVAGNDTTSNMTQWFLNYMARFQDVQEKIQKEIDRVVPRGTLPGLQHRNELAYLDATINEVQRHCSMAPLGVFRSTTSDVKIDGYDIPKGTIVMSVAGLSHRNPVYFKDPDKFDPSRFLDKNGKFISTCDGFQAFGIGKRQCLGEQFARMELYLITAALMQNFKFGPPDGEGPMSIEADVVPVTHMPRKEQKYYIQYRN